MPLILKTLAKPKSLLAFAGLFFFVFCVWFAHASGVDSERVKWQKERIKILAQSESDLKLAIQKERELQKRESEKVIRQIQRSREAERNERKLQSQILSADFACPDLGGEFMRLFNESIQSAQGTR